MTDASSWIVNLIVILILLCIIGGIIFYLVWSKKKNKHCIGCPYAGQCSGGCNEIKHDSK